MSLQSFTSIHPIIVETFQRWLNCLLINRLIYNGNNLLAVLHLRTCGNAVKQRENSDWFPLLCCNWRIQLGWLLKQRVKRKKSHWWEQDQIDKLYRTYSDIISFIYDDDLVWVKSITNWMWKWSVLMRVNLHGLFKCYKPWSSSRTDPHTFSLFAFSYVRFWLKCIYDLRFTDRQLKVSKYCI